MNASRLGILSSWPRRREWPKVISTRAFAARACAMYWSSSASSHPFRLIASHDMT